MHACLVRHALALDRFEWEDDDDLRPLTDGGRQQAAGLVAILAPESPRRIISSPSLRCIDTVAPLAIANGLAIEIDARLHETADPAALLAWLRGMDEESVVLSSHGEPMQSVLVRLIESGARVEATDHALRVRKASSWIVHGDTTGEVAIRPIAPPAKMR